MSEVQEEIEAAARASEETIALVYDMIVEARDLLRLRLDDDTDPLHVIYLKLQDAKYALGGRTNIAGLISARLPAAIEARDKALERAERYKQVLSDLERAATRVSDKGATPGDHFVRLTTSILRARSALGEE